MRRLYIGIVRVRFRAAIGRAGRVSLHNSNPKLQPSSNPGQASSSRRHGREPATPNAGPNGHF